MKLNLLPKSVSKNVQTKTVFTVMLALIGLSLLGAILVFMRVSGELSTLQTEANAKTPLANQVADTAASADTILSQANILLTNTKLVAAIDDANRAYPDLYDELIQYIPGFFRVQAMSAASAGAGTSTVTITGYLRSFQQYADMMIALLRFPGTVSVGRSGFGPVAPGDEGPFGYNPQATDRGPIPGWSVTTFTMQIQRDLQAPEPRATLQQAAGAAPARPGAPPTPTVGAPAPASAAPAGAAAGDETVPAVGSVTQGN